MSLTYSILDKGHNRALSYSVKYNKHESKRLSRYINLQHYKTEMTTLRIFFEQYEHKLRSYIIIITIEHRLCISRAVYLCRK